MYTMFYKRPGVWNILIGQHSGAKGIGTMDKIFWAGGDLGNGISSNLIEIDDINGSTSSFAHLTVPRIYPQGAIYKGRIVFLSGYICCDWPLNEFDWYDLNSGAWSTGVLEQDLNYDVGVIAYGSKLYVAGGVHLNKGSLSTEDYTDQVWVLDF